MGEKAAAEVGMAAVQTAPEAETKTPQPDDSVSVAEFGVLKKQFLEVAEDLIAAYPNEPAALMPLGIAYARFGETGKALQFWQHGLDLNSGRADIYNAMATILLESGKHEKAAEICQAVLAKSSGTPVLYCIWSEALNGLGRSEDALRKLQRAVELFPSDAQCHRLLGKAYLLLGEYEKARDSYETSVKLQPRDFQAHYGLSVAYARLGMEGQSQRALGEYRKLQAQITSAQRTGMMEATQEIDAYRSALESACFNAAVIYARHNRLEKAEELLRRGAGAAPNGVNCRVQLAILCLHSNRAPEAIAICKQLIAIEPKNFNHYVALATIYAQLGRFDDARAAAKQAVDLAPDNENCRRLLLQLQGRR